jgi:hypothetical protein
MQALRRVAFNDINDDDTQSVSVDKLDAKSADGVKLDDKSKFSEETIAEQAHDPINWFGVLVPSSLRDAQMHFINVVKHSVPHTINASGQMRHLEIEIARLRKSIKKLEKSIDLNLPPTASAS